MIPVVLTIAGFDCSAGAGLQADLKTVTALGTHALTAATCLVAETPNQVTRIDPVHPDMLHEQISLLLSSYPVAAIKLGMLYDTPQIQVVATQLAQKTSIPVICDPVMVASTGNPLLKPGALSLFQNTILPLCSILTPNRAEAEFLLGSPIETTEAAKSAAKDLSQRFDAHCFLKGGHISPSSDEAIDIVSLTTGTQHLLSSKRLPIKSSHGTGCTFAAAVTAGIALGQSPLQAAKTAKDFVHHSLSTAHTWASHNITAINQTNNTTL